MLSPDIGGSVCGPTIAVGDRPRWLPRQTAHMRALFASTRGAGHFNPLVPFARAFERGRHELLFAGPPDLARAVDAARFEFWQFDPPPEDELGAVWSRVPQLPPDEANEVVVGEVFGRLNTTAALPRLREACEEWRPDVVVRDPNEYGSALAAELHGIPHARVAIGLASTEELGLGIAASAIDAIRREQGLPSDQAAAVLRDSPYLSLFPPTLDEGVQPDTHRFRDPAWEEPPGELPDWWPGRPDEPLVYVTFGSVAGSFPQALPVYDVAMRAVAELPVRVLFTVGRELDLGALPAAPENVRVERWVPQQDVLGHAAAAVVHGGSGSTLGAIAAGVPLVVVPLFADQPQNAARVAEVGAGVAIVPDREAPEAALSPLREAILEVLRDESYGERAAALAAELRAQPVVDEVVPLAERLGELDRGMDAGDGRTLFPFSAGNAELVQDLEGLRLDDLALACARSLRAGQIPPAAEMTIQMGEDGEPHFTVFHIWDRAPATAFRELSEAHPVHRPGRFFLRDAPWGVAVPADPALTPQLTEFLEAHPELDVEEPAAELLEELMEEYERASDTVALSYADDAELDGLELGGELHPFQRAGVRYALERRRTFIADEQGLGKTVQALATIEVDDAFPAVVVCPASMKLVWERETQHWLPHRRVAVLGGRTDSTWTDATREAEIVVLNYDILDWHADTLAELEPRTLVLDESNYLKNTRAARSNVALELAERLPDDALRLALTGTPILNRAEELVSQLRIIGRLKDFGSGARLTRRV